MKRRDVLLDPPPANPDLSPPPNGEEVEREETGRSYLHRLLDVVLDGIPFAQEAWLRLCHAPLPAAIRKRVRGARTLLVGCVDLDPARDKESCSTTTIAQNDIDLTSISFHWEPVAGCEREPKIAAIVAADRVVWTSGNPVSLDAFKDPKLAECIAGYTLRPGLGLYVSVLPVGAAGRLSVVATGVRY